MAEKYIKRNKDTTVSNSGKLEMMQTHPSEHNCNTGNYTELHKEAAIGHQKQGRASSFSGTGIPGTQ